MQKGIAKWLNNRKGYGFIVYNKEDETSVHFTAIEDDKFKSPDENQSVEFEIMEGNRGLQAAHVEEIDN